MYISTVYCNYVSEYIFIITEYIGRVLSFFSSRRNWDSANPLPAGECAPPPPVLGGGAHSLARERLGRSQFRRGDIHCGTLYIYAYFVFIINQKIYAADVYKLCLFNLYINMSASIHPVGILISLRQPFYLYLSLCLGIGICKNTFFLYFCLHTVHIFLYVSASIFTKIVTP